MIIASRRAARPTSFHCGIQLIRRQSSGMLSALVIGASILPAIAGLGGCARKAPEALRETEQTTSAVNTVQEPKLIRIKSTTIGATDLAPIEE